MKTQSTKVVTYESRAKQHVAVFGLKTGIPAKPEANGEPKPEYVREGQGLGAGSWQLGGAVHIHLKSVWTVAEAVSLSPLRFLYAN